MLTQSRPRSLGPLLVTLTLGAFATGCAGASGVRVTDCATGQPLGDVIVFTPSRDRQEPGPNESRTKADGTFTWMSVGLAEVLKRRLVKEGYAERDIEVPRDGMASACLDPAAAEEPTQSEPEEPTSSEPDGEPAEPAEPAEG